MKIVARELLSNNVLVSRLVVTCESPIVSREEAVHPDLHFDDKDKLHLRAGTSEAITLAIPSWVPGTGSKPLYLLIYFVFTITLWSTFQLYIAAVMACCNHESE